MTFTPRHTKYASYLGYITQAIINNLSPLLFVIFQDSFEISVDRIAILISVNFGTQIIVDFIGAKFIDRIGYRICVVAAHIFSMAGMIGLGTFPFLFGNPFAGLLLATVLNGIGGGLIEVLVSPIVEALPGDEKESAMSLLHSFYSWGYVGVVILTTVYFGIFGIEQWRYLPMVWAAVPAFNALFFTKVPLYSLIAEGEVRIPLRRLFTNKIFWLLFLMMVCSGASEQGMSQWSSYFAETGLGVSKTLGDLMGPCAFAILMAISRTLYGFYGTRMNLKLTIQLSAVLCVCSYLLATLAPHPLLALAGCALCGFSVGIMWPGVFSLSAKAYPQGGTSMFAILALAGDLGCSSGPGLTGGLAKVFGSFHYGLLFAGIFPLLMFLCIRILNRQRA